MRSKLTLLAAFLLVVALILPVGIGAAANSPQVYTASVKLQNSTQASPAASGTVTVWFNADKSIMFYTIQLSNAYGPFKVTLVRNNQTIATLHAGTPGTTCPTDKSLLYNGLLYNAQIYNVGNATLPSQIAGGNVYAVVQTACGTMQSLLKLKSSTTPAATSTVSILSPTTTGVIPGSTNGTKGTFVSATEVVFSWNAVSGANAYRVSLVQEAAGGNKGGEFFISHHSASDPNPTRFTMSMYGWTQYLCAQCRTRLVVKPMLATQTYDSATQQFVWSYSPLPGGATQNSQYFWLSGLPTP